MTRPMEAVRPPRSADRSRPASAADRTPQLLRGAAILFTVAVLLHNSDHLRRGADAIGRDVFWIGSAAMIVEVGVVMLIFLRHRLAPLAAMVAGFSLAVGYTFVHFTPSRSWLSDSFVSGAARGISVGAAGLETAAAVVLGMVGAYVMRHGQPASANHTVNSRGLLHPVVLAMLVGNVTIFVASLVQLLN